MLLRCCTCMHRYVDPCNLHLSPTIARINQPLCSDPFNSSRSQSPLTHHHPQRWHGYCHACLPRVSTSLIQQLDGRFNPCRCERSDTAKRYRGHWICLSCFEDECNEVLGQGFDSKECQGRGCGTTVAQVGWDKFQPVCGWCLRIVDAKGMEGAKQALRDGEGFESLRRDSRRS